MRLGFVFSIFLLFSMCFSFPAVVRAAFFYVDQNHVSANDSNGGAEDQPWKTIQKAANVLQAGDTVYVKEGVYTELHAITPESGKIGLKPQNSGTADNFITYEAYAGDTVVLDQQWGGIGFFLYNKHYIKIKGFEIRNVMGSGGVWTRGSNSHIWVEDCYIHDIDGNAGANIAGIRFDQISYPVARNNVIHTVRVAGQDNLNSAAILSYEMENALIENNEFYDAHNGVFHKKSTGNTGALIRKNLIHDVSRGVYYNLSGSGNAVHINQRVSQNVFYNVKFGVWLNAPDAIDVHDGLHVWNNVIDGADVAVYARNARGINIYNNIVRGPNAFAAIAMGTDVVSIDEIDYNNYYNAEKFDLDYNVSQGALYTSLSAWQAQGYDNHSSNINPLFVDVSARDYHLQSGSPLLGAGKEGVHMGAYLSSEDVIGPVSDDVAVLPSPPQNLRVIVQ